MPQPNTTDINDLMKAGARRRKKLPTPATDPMAAGAEMGDRD
jgi:hypothetical protein